MFTVCKIVQSVQCAMFAKCAQCVQCLQSVGSYGERAKCRPPQCGTLPPSPLCSRHRTPKDTLLCFALQCTAQNCTEGTPHCSQHCRAQGRTPDAVQKLLQRYCGRQNPELRANKAKCKGTVGVGAVGAVGAVGGLKCSTLLDVKCILITC